MAEQNEPTKRTKTVDGDDQRMLEEMAQKMYVDLASGRMRNRDPEEIARQAYIDAAAFTRVTIEHRNGKPIARQQTREVALFVVVNLWNMADTEKSVHGSPMVDQNGTPVIEIQPVDRHAFAPKLPKDHPINQRFLGNAIHKMIRTPQGEQVPAICNHAGIPITADELKELKEFAPAVGGTV